MTDPPTIHLPAGRWGVAVSGGADSVALLRLANQQQPGRLHVLHLNHETRGEESDGDAEFVRQLAEQLNLPATIATRTSVEQALSPAQQQNLPTNPSARYRALRLALYRAAAQKNQLDGVLLAHHADDQAETVMLRLLRGGGYSALAGIAEDAVVGGVRLVRPLLQLRREELRRYLDSVQQPWREDASNAGDTYARNRVRKALLAQPSLATRLLSVARSCANLRDWAEQHAPRLEDRFATRDVALLPDLLALTAIADWLMRQGVPADAAINAHARTVLTMCRDAASSPAHTLPGGIGVRRRGGAVSRTSG